jgi:hypothetical protein
MRTVLLSILSAPFVCGCRLAFSAALQLLPGSSNQYTGVLGINALHTTITNDSGRQAVTAFALSAAAGFCLTASPSLGTRGGPT